MEVDALSKGKRKGKKGSSGFGKGKGQKACVMLCVGTVASLATMRKTVYRSGHRNTEWSGKKGESKGKSKGKGKLNSIENWQEDVQGDEHADRWTWNDEHTEEWWKAAGDQNGSSSAQWANANVQTAWEPGRPIGGLEMNSIETKYIEQDGLGQNWLRLNYNSGAAVTALPIVIAGDLPLEKCGEFRVASGAVLPNLGKIKIKSMDESGIERTVRGNITEVSKPLLSAAEASKRWDSILFEDGGILLERRSPVALEVRAILKKSTRSGIVMARTSGSTSRATCTMHRWELAMLHRSLHPSNQQRGAGP